MYDLFFVGPKQSYTASLKSQYPSLKIIESEDSSVSEDILKRISSMCLTSWFFVIHDTNVFYDLADIKLNNEDSNYVIIFNNTLDVKVYNKKSVKNCISSYSDDAIKNGLVRFKNIEKKIFHIRNHDIVFLSYKEPNANDNYSKLLCKFPKIKRVHGVKGIFEAHRQAAHLASTSMFYVIDADAEVLDNFDFSYIPDIHNNLYTHIWRSMNPINNLEYGYGGIKLFPTQIVRDAETWNTDFTLSASKGIKIIDSVSNITRFNTDPFSTWRSAFRESVKLTLSCNDKLSGWLMNANREELYYEYCLAGARDGHKFATENKNVENFINNFDWLEDEFNRKYNI